MLRRLVLTLAFLGAVSSVAPATAAPVAPVSPTAASEGLLDIRSIVPDAVVDLRYATSQNFVKQRLYPPNARCLVHQSMANGLRVAASKLRATGYRLVFWDCYRPHSAQVRMYEVVPDANWVARPGNYARSHEAGRSVDVTLIVRDGHRVDMGTGFDDFTARAHAYARAGLSAAAVGNRARLRSAMQAGGLSPYSGEWWHFDGPGAGVDRPHLRAAVN
ncbi:M15 family metallopeptidase [Gordonia sp. CPCC 205333]|uniref:M15 family metallopeptidase n=1 Tax=Gordonia sp. CPCC 205333 TaxID=3140790 RepID=UPI003AF35752